MTASRLHRRLAMRDLVLPSFTDEELAAVRPQSGADLVPLAAVDRLDPSARRAVLDAAGRALVGQGHALTIDERLWPVGALRFVIELRARPSMVGIAAREGDELAGTRFLHGVGRDAVLEERVDNLRVHRFVLRTIAGTAELLAAWCAEPSGGPTTALLWTARPGPRRQRIERSLTIVSHPVDGISVDESEVAPRAVARAELPRIIVEILGPPGGTYPSSESRSS